MALRQISTAVNDGGGSMLKLSIEDLKAAKAEFDNHISNLIERLDEMHKTLLQFNTNVNKNVWAGPDADVIRAIIESQMETIHTNGVSFTNLKQDVDKAIDNLIAWMNSNGFANINNEYYNELITTRNKAIATKDYYNGEITKLQNRSNSRAQYKSRLFNAVNKSNEKIINNYRGQVAFAEAVIEECDNKIRAIEDLPNKDQAAANAIIESLGRVGLSSTN